MLKVLLIDNDKKVLRILRDDLKQEFAVLICENLERAFEFCKLISPDVIVLDPAIPCLGPGNFISKVRSLPGKADILVVSVSYSALIRKVEENYDWGADYYFSKPLVPSRVSLKIKELLQKKGMKFLPANSIPPSFKNESNLEFRFPIHSGQNEVQT